MRRHWRKPGNDIPVCPAALAKFRHDIRVKEITHSSMSRGGGGSRSKSASSPTSLHGKQMLHEYIRVRLLGTIGSGPSAVGVNVSSQVFCNSTKRRCSSRECRCSSRESCLGVESRLMPRRGRSSVAYRRIQDRSPRSLPPTTSVRLLIFHITRFESSARAVRARCRRPTARMCRGGFATLPTRVTTLEPS